MTEEDLKVFVRSFLEPNRCERWLTLLGSAKGRAKICSTLDHGFDFDNRFATHLGGDCSPDAVVDLLHKAGAPKKCSLISSNLDWDGKEMDLTEALDLVFMSGFGTYVVCVPDRLAYFESEERDSRYLLQR